MYSILSFIPAEGATPNTEGFYGYVCVIQQCETKELAEQSVNVLMESATLEQQEIFLIINGTSFAPCMSPAKYPNENRIIFTDKEPTLISTPPISPLSSSASSPLPQQITRRFSF